MTLFASSGRLCIRVSKCRSSLWTSSGRPPMNQAYPRSVPGLATRSRLIQTSRRQFSSAPPPLQPSSKPSSGSGSGSSSILWQLGLGVGVMGAYFGANYVISKTNESINEDGELVTASDGAGMPEYNWLVLDLIAIFA